MFVIRAAQLECMAQPAREALLDVMCVHAASNFSALATSIPAPALRVQVRAVLMRAKKYGLHTMRDIRMFLNLACQHGWQFDDMPQYAWMRATLLDDAAGTPSARLNLLAERSVHEEEIASYNLRLRQAFADGVVEPARSMPYHAMGAGLLEDSDTPIAGAAAWLARQFQYDAYLARLRGGRER